MDQKQADLKALGVYIRSPKGACAEINDIWLAARESLREEMGPPFAEVLKALRSPVDPPNGLQDDEKYYTAIHLLVADWLEQHFKTIAGYRNKGE